MERIKALLLSVVAGIFYVIIMTIMFVATIILFFDNKNKWAAKLQEDILD